MSAFPARFPLLLLACTVAVTLSGALSWVAVRDYHEAGPLALENLRGLALTMVTTMEGVAGRDASLQSLKLFQTPEVAYIAMVGGDGVICFHSNSELIGKTVSDIRYQSVLQGKGLSEERIVLATGETVYEFQTLAHLPGQTCVLRLALHTWRAETVMRRARQAMITVFSLLAVGWGLGFMLLWFLWRQTQRERHQARRRELERLGEVGAVLAHEMRNPLAGIKGYGQLLEERLPEGRERGFAALIVSESWRLERLARDILLYTRSGPVEKGPSRPAAIVARVIALLAAKVEQKDVRIECDISSFLQVTCSEEALQQVFLNVLDNAVQASPVGGLVLVTARYTEDGSMVEITVRDNGSGIAENMRGVLFEPFQTSRARGAGLGLAVCRKIVEACGGGIDLHNGETGGAECLIRLPVVLEYGVEGV